MTYADLLTGALALGLLGYLGIIVLVYRRTRDPGMTTILLLASYWTVLGAFPILATKRLDNGVNYTYMEDRLFTIVVDGAYTETLAAYLLFLVLTALVTLLLSRDASRNTPIRAGWDRLNADFSHVTMICVVTAITAAKVVIVLLLLRAIGETGLSLYAATRTVKGDAAGLLRIYQYLNILSSYSLSAGLALWLGYRGTPTMRRSTRAFVWAGYGLLGALVFAENALLGNRAVPLIVMAAAATGWIRWGFLRASRARRGPMLLRFTALTLAGLVVLGTIGVSRGGSLTSPAAVAEAMVTNVSKIGNVVGQVVGSSEMVASHMSLYGVIREENLVHDAWSANSYGTYADLVQAPEDQVFTVHYVAAWWLRTGPLGVILAAVSFALALILLQRISWRPRSLWAASFALPAAVLPAAGAPVILMRSGPEALRAVFVELVVLPGLVCGVCLLAGRSRNSRKAVHAREPALFTASQGELHVNRTH